MCKHVYTRWINDVSDEYTYLPEENNSTILSMTTMSSMNESATNNEIPTTMSSMNKSTTNNESLPIEYSVPTRISKCTRQYKLSRNVRRSLCKTEGHNIVDIRFFLLKRGTIKGIALSHDEWKRLLLIGSGLYISMKN